MSIIGNAVTLSGGGEPTLLWTNPSPTDTFSSQIMELPTGYGAYFVEVRATRTDSTVRAWYLPFRETSEAIHVTVGSGLSAQSYYRQILYITDGAIRFGNGYQSTTTNDRYAIPTRIWGVKWTI